MLRGRNMREDRQENIAGIMAEKIGSSVRVMMQKLITRGRPNSLG